MVSRGSVSLASGNTARRGLETFHRGTAGVADEREEVPTPARGSPSKYRAILKIRGLTHAILDELRAACAPTPSREIARATLIVNELDPKDRKLLTVHTRRVSKALRILKLNGLVHRAKDQAGNMVWARIITPINNPHSPDDL